MYVGDETDAYEFEVPTVDPTDGYVGIQAFDVGEYGHDILVNGEPMSGFDIPPDDGWQYWVDTFDDTNSLTRGTASGSAARRTPTTPDGVAVLASLVSPEPTRHRGRTVPPRIYLNPPDTPAGSHSTVRANSYHGTG